MNRERGFLMPLATGPTVTFAWRPNGPGVDVCEGVKYLVALTDREQIDGDSLTEYAVVELDCGDVLIDGGPCPWKWSDVEWYVPVAELGPYRPDGG
jgi:hypothetical protein